MLIYGGLNFYNTKQDNQKLARSQQDLTVKLSQLENKIDADRQKIDELINNLKQAQEETTHLKQKNQAVLGASAQETNIETQIIEETVSAAPIVQTVAKTKTVVVEKSKKEASVIIQNVGSYKVAVKTGDTAFSALQRAASQNGFTIKYQDYSFGVFVTEIANIKPAGSQYWAFYYNGQYSQVGASAQKISANDTIFWQLESF